MYAVVFLGVFSLSSLYSMSMAGVPALMESRDVGEPNAALSLYGCARALQF